MSGVGQPEFRVQICDGCCCGTAGKHPDVDHANQRARLVEAARVGGGQARIVGCLDECQASNVVIVRRRDGTAIWLGEILRTDVTAALCRWLSSGAAAMPTALADHVFAPRRVAVAVTLAQRVSLPASPRMQT